MVQGIGKENIFPDDNTKGYYLTSIQKAKERCKGARILSFCVMSNHAHILLSVNNVKTLSMFMNYVNSEYARYYNNENDRVGYVFRDRFKSEVISDKKHLLNCLAYIHNNPVKAKIAGKAEEYRYSSYTNYLKEREGILDFEEAGKHYDISPSNIAAIMKEKSHSDWIEHDDKTYEDSEDVLENLIKKYNISGGKIDYDLGAKMAKELIERSGLSLRKAADLLGIGRETLRKVFLEIC